MNNLADLIKNIGELPVVGLIAVIVLGAFALAAFAIYAMLKVSKVSR